MSRTPTSLAALAILLSVASHTGASSAIVFEPEADTMVRTDLGSRANDNYGCDPSLTVGGSRGGGGIPYGGPDGIRTLLRFDLSGLTSPVTSAVLEIRLNRFYSFSSPQIYQLDVHRIVESWQEGNGAEASPIPDGCVWVDPAWGVAWVGAGDGGDVNNETQPDFVASLAARTIVDESDFEPYGTTEEYGFPIQWDLTALVNDWIGGTPNHGIVVRDVTSDGTFKHIFLLSREAPVHYGHTVPGPRLLLTLPPVHECRGFEPPMASRAVTVRGNRTLPLKAQLIDQDGFLVTDFDIVAPPVIQVLLDTGEGGNPLGVTGESLPSGQGTYGDQIFFDGDNRWHLNFRTKDYTAPGTYLLFMDTGDSSEYQIDPTCYAAFIRE